MVNLLLLLYLNFFTGLIFLFNWRRKKPSLNWFIVRTTNTNISHIYIFIIITVLFTNSSAEWIFLFETHCDWKATIDRWNFFQKIIIIFERAISILIHYNVVSKIRLGFIIIILIFFWTIINLVFLLNFIFCILVSSVHIIILIIFFYCLILRYIDFCFFFFFINLIYLLNIRIKYKVWRLLYLVLVVLGFIFIKYFVILVMNRYLRRLILIKIWGSHHEKSEFPLKLSLRIDKGGWWTLNSILILYFFFNYWFFDFVILLFLFSNIWIIICEFFFEILNVIFEPTCACRFLMNTDILTLIFLLLIHPFGSVLVCAFKFIVNQRNLTAFEVPLIFDCCFLVHVGMVKIIRCKFIILIVDVVACHQ